MKISLSVSIYKGLKQFEGIMYNIINFRNTLSLLDFWFLKKLGCCVGGRDQNKNLVLSNELINVELPP